MIVEWYDMAVCSPRESAVYWIVRQYAPGMSAVDLANYGRGYWYVFGYEDPIEAEELRYWAHVAWPALPPIADRA